MRTFGCKEVQIHANHHVFNHINFVQKVVAVGGGLYGKGTVCPLIRDGDCIPHALQCGLYLFFVQFDAQFFVDGRKRCVRRLLEIVRCHHVLPKACVVGMVRLYGQNGVPCIKEVAGYDICGEHQVFHVVAGQFNEQVFVTHLNLSQRGAVDDGRHAEHFACVIGQERPFCIVLQNPAVILAFGMVLYDFAERLPLRALQGNKACGIRVGGGLVHGPLDLCLTVYAHADALALAPKVPAELFLCLHDVHQHGVVDGLSADDERHQIRADVFKPCVNVDVPVSGVF